MTKLRLSSSNNYDVNPAGSVLILQPIIIDGTQSPFCLKSIRKGHDSVDQLSQKQKYLKQEKQSVDLHLLVQTVQPLGLLKGGYSCCAVNRIRYTWSTIQLYYVKQSGESRTAAQQFRQ